MRLRAAGLRGDMAEAPFLLQVLRKKFCQEVPGGARRSQEEPGGGGGGGCQGMPRDAKGRARSKRECDVETLATRILHKLLWQSKGVRKNDKQVAKQP